MVGCVVVGVGVNVWMVVDVLVKIQRVYDQKYNKTDSPHCKNDSAFNLTISGSFLANCPSNRVVFRATGQPTKTTPEEEARVGERKKTSRNPSIPSHDQLLPHARPSLPGPVLPDPETTQGPYGRRFVKR